MVEQDAWLSIRKAAVPQSVDAAANHDQRHNRTTKSEHRTEPQIPMKDPSSTKVVPLLWIIMHNTITKHGTNLYPHKHVDSVPARLTMPGIVCRSFTISKHACPV